MREGPDITRIAQLIGDPAREAMLSALMSGKALTAKELAAEAGVTAPTASGHLAQLTEARLLTVLRQGRHRYYALAGAEVAQAIEALTGLAARQGHLRTRPGPRDAALRDARVCYDHLAGARAVAIYERLVTAGHLTLEHQALGLTPSGAAYFGALGIDLASLRAKRRPLCRMCLDWSERRPHLAGALGAALLDLMLERGWARRSQTGRAVEITPPGHLALNRLFPLVETA